jgi:geranylgeranyl diphosphate synthase type I
MIEKKLADFKKRIDPLIKKYLEGKIEKYRKIFPESVVLIEQIKDLTLRGGDRIRPTIFYYGFLLVRKPTDKEEKELLRISTAFELFHSFALIHDDIIDSSLLRRGKKTVNRYFEEKFKNGWGDKLAILTGDLAELFPQEIFQSDSFGENLKKGNKLFYELKEELAIGEYMDTILPLKDELPDERKIKEILCFKSGYYSVQKPLLMGAALAGGSNKDLGTLENVGRKLGLAFQIRDDILGIFGKEKTIGKSVKSDILDGKRTLLIVETLKKLHDREKRERFLDHFGRKDISMNEIILLKEMIRKTGALDYCQKECKKLVTAVKCILARSKFRQEAKLFLTDFSDFLISREY